MNFVKILLIYRFMLFGKRSGFFPSLKRVKNWLTGHSRLGKHGRLGHLIGTWSLVEKYRGFSRRPCWRTETMKQFRMKIQSYFPEERKCIVFALQHGGNDVTWKCSIHFIWFLTTWVLGNSNKCDFVVISMLSRVKNSHYSSCSSQNHSVPISFSDTLEPR